MKKKLIFDYAKSGSAALVTVVIAVGFFGCAKRSPNSSLPLNSAPPNPVVRTPETERKALLPLISNWFENHGQRFASAIADGDRLVVNIPGLKTSPATDKLAKEFASAWRTKLIAAGFANDFELKDLGTKNSKTYQLKSIDVMARETVLKAVDLWFISQKKIKTTSTLDPADDTKLVVTSPDFNDDNHTTLTIEFSVKEGKGLRDLGFNPMYTVTNGRESWMHKLY